MPRLPTVDRIRIRFLEKIPLRLTYRGAVWEVARGEHGCGTFPTYAAQVLPRGEIWIFANSQADEKSSDRELYEVGVEFIFAGTLPRRLAEQLVKEGRAERIV